MRTIGQASQGYREFEREVMEIRDGIGHLPEDKSLSEGSLDSKFIAEARPLD